MFKILPDVSHVDNSYVNSHYIEYVDNSHDNGNSNTHNVLL